MRAVACVTLGALALAACGGGGGGGGGASCTPTNTAALTITATGLSPTNVCVLPGGTVTFTNSDTVTRTLEYETSNCPTIPSIPPNGGTVTVTYPTAATCTFHDASQSGNTAFRGTVAISNGTVSGGGY